MLENVVISGQANKEYAKSAGAVRSWSLFPSSRRKIYQWIYDANGPWHVLRGRQWKLKKGDRRWMADSLLKDTSPWEGPAFRPFEGWPSTAPSSNRASNITRARLDDMQIFLLHFPEIFVSIDASTARLEFSNLNFSEPLFENTFVAICVFLVKPRSYSNCQNNSFRNFVLKKNMQMFLVKWTYLYYSI